MIDQAQLVAKITTVLTDSCDPEVVVDNPAFAIWFAIIWNELTKFDKEQS